MKLSVTKILLFMLCLGFVSACGFQLRGAYTFPFKTATIESPKASPEFTEQLRRSMVTQGSVTLVEAKDKPQARIRILEVFSDKRILSLSSGGKVREFVLEQRIKFDVVDEGDRALLEETTIAATRDFSFSDAQALAKESEERILRADMQTDLVAQMLRQLQAARLSAVR